MFRRIAFLTGGTGFIGGHVARALCAQGWAVRALSRKAPDFPPDLPIEVVAGDLSERSNEVLRGALRGCEAIVHVAGLVKARSLEDYREVNVAGTQRLLTAGKDSAREALFLLVSSQAAAGPAREERPVREEDTPRPVSWYGLSKLEAEEEVAREWQGPWLVLRPGVVFGPGDRGLLTLFAAASRGWVPAPAASRRIQIIHSSRTALGIARAAGRLDLSGKRGFLCDPDPITVGNFAAAIARLPERPARLVPVPDLLVRVAGAVETLREAVTGRSRPFNADKAREILAGDWLCEPAMMQRHLDLPPPSPLEDALREMWNWYRQHRWLPL
ncbi:MAG TPA: NAD-dependent epimerase/dehydratase family protein [Thermoanaerobaculia bacterium]|nr:NAD-dependent epimerase/dehydratase family protein [Thermoanaerobaculia bacterium]